MKLLILTSRFPYPVERGDKLRIFHQIVGLSKYFEIILVALSDFEVEKKDYEVVKPYCKSIHVFRLNKKKVILKTGFSLLGNKPMQVNYFYNKKIQKSIDNLISQEQPDRIYCQLIRMAEYIKDQPIPKVLDYMDGFSVNTKRWSLRAPFWQKWLWKMEAKKLKEYEQTIYHKFDGHTIISAQDKMAMGLVNGMDVRVLPNGVDTDFFVNKNKIEKAYQLIFVGNMGYQPNIKAARFLVEEILPLVQNEIKNLNVLIAGARPSTEVKRLASSSVKISGWVEDIRDAYAAGFIFCAPLFLGAGQQNKILEAMAMGIPCITTPMVNNAIGAKEGAEILLAEKPIEFAEAILKLWEDEEKREKMAIEAHSFVCKNYSWDFYVKELEKLIKQEYGKAK